MDMKPNFRFAVCILLLVLLVGVVDAATYILHPEYDAQERKYGGTAYVFPNIMWAGSQYHDEFTTGGWYLECTGTEGYYTSHRSFGMTFNTTNISSDLIIESARLDLYGHSKSNTRSGALPYATIIKFEPLNPFSYEHQMWNTLNKTVITSNITYNDFAVDGWNNFTFVGDLDYAINFGGYTILAIASNLEMDLAPAPTWGVWNSTSWDVRGMRYAGSDYTPVLTIITEAGGDPPVASFTTDKTLVRIPGTLQFNDTSTNTPTGWNWSFGDGTYSEDENPMHKYTKRGKWNVTLTATNDAGSDESAATTVRVIGYETYT